MKNLSPIKEIERGWPERVGNPGILGKGHRKRVLRAIMSNATVVVEKDVPLEFCTRKVICDSSKSRFWLMVGK